ncbi:MAG: hypothetical protein JW748_06550, partial [Anaerolineales bacterium]|nr:hypothetical protein [Anaerolineales bacterium]
DDGQDRRGGYGHDRHAGVHLAGIHFLPQVFPLMDPAGMTDKFGAGVTDTIVMPACTWPEAILRKM